jgi:hypothetical protein
MIPPIEDEKTVDWKELRSGNLVQGEPISIPKWGWHGNGITRITAYGIHMLEQGVGKYKPIQLTTEILLETTFKENDQDKHGRILFEDLEGYNGWGKFQIGNTADEDWSFYANGGFIGHPFQYLHQLQNLYVALTGKELKINL